MKDQVKSYIYRGIKYTSEQLKKMQKSSKNVRKDLMYRGVKYMDSFRKKVSSKGMKKTYRGVKYY